MAVLIEGDFEMGAMQPKNRVCHQLRIWVKGWADMKIARKTSRPVRMKFSPKEDRIAEIVGDGIVSDIRFQLTKQGF